MTGVFCRGNYFSLAEAAKSKQRLGFSFDFFLAGCLGFLNAFFEAVDSTQTTYAFFDFIVLAAHEWTPVVGWLVNWTLVKRVRTMGSEARTVKSRFRLPCGV
jgi:hypothetical protein